MIKYEQPKTRRCSLDINEFKKKIDVCGSLRQGLKTFEEFDRNSEQGDDEYEEALRFVEEKDRFLAMIIDLKMWLESFDAHNHRERKFFLISFFCMESEIEMEERGDAYRLVEEMIAAYPAMFTGYFPWIRLA